MSLPQAIIAAMPGSVRQTAQRTGVEDVSHTMHVMRQEGFLARSVVDKVYVYRVGPKPMPEGWAPPLGPAAASVARSLEFGARRAATRAANKAAHQAQRAAAVPRVLTPEEEAEKKQRKERKRHTILVSIKDWPHQDPGRLMIFTWRPSPMKAANEAKRLRSVMPELDWSIEPLSMTQQRAVALKPFSLREYRARQEAAKAS